jgi:hypothetical protein
MFKEVTEGLSHQIQNICIEMAVVKRNKLTGNLNNKICNLELRLYPLLIIVSAKSGFFVI